MCVIDHYLTADGADPYVEWLSELGNVVAKVNIARRVARIETGNFGDHKFCRYGVWELRIDVGQGYRVYFARHHRHGILLLGGGGKPRQNADITQAVKRWQDWQQRMSIEKQQIP